jgi:hypothetical protein
VKNLIPVITFLSILLINPCFGSGIIVLDGNEEIGVLKLGNRILLSQVKRNGVITRTGQQQKDFCTQTERRLKPYLNDVRRFHCNQISDLNRVFCNLIGEQFERSMYGLNSEVVKDQFSIKAKLDSTYSSSRKAKLVKEVSRKLGINSNNIKFAPLPTIPSMGKILVVNKSNKRTVFTKILKYMEIDYKRQLELVDGNMILSSNNLISCELDAGNISLKAYSENRYENTVILAEDIQKRLWTSYKYILKNYLLEIDDGSTDFMKKILVSGYIIKGMFGKTGYAIDSYLNLEKIFSNYFRIEGEEGERKWIDIKRFSSIEELKDENYPDQLFVGKLKTEWSLK